MNVRIVSVGTKWHRETRLVLIARDGTEFEMEGVIAISEGGSELGRRTLIVEFYPDEIEVGIDRN